MSINLWTTRTPAWLHRQPLRLAVVLLAFAPSLPAQALHPTSENGRTVWTNDAPVVSARPAVHAQQPQLYYWSDVQHRWKAVKPATPAAMRSARTIAGEVSSYIESKPQLDASTPTKVKGELAGENPNYAAAAEHRSVSAAEIDRFIKEAAARHHVDPNLVRALVKVESNYNPRALSSKGAMGLMQLMPATARMYDLHNPFDAAQNVDAGVRHLKGLLENFKGDVSLSLAAYNAGQGAVERSRGIPPYTETRNYVKRITNLMGSASEPRFSSLSIPLQVRRDERGRLVISNTD
jgi:soluble lytic murein transglycosylase-like protein